jgi:hypothetical protein
VFTQAVHVNGMFSFINKKRKINRLSWHCGKFWDAAALSAVWTRSCCAL